MAAGGHGTKAVVAALLANGGIALAKFVGFGITRSPSMLAEAIHSVADTGNQGLLLLGGKKARRAADKEHPFGYGRERYFWSFVVALMLFTVGGMFAIYEGVQKIREPHHLDSAGVAVAILVFAIILEVFSFRTAIIESNHVKGPDVGWWSFIRRSKHPELPVVLLEDLGALCGLVFALAAVVTTILTDEPIFDAIGTLSIGILLVVIAAILAFEMKGLLIGEGASARDERAIIAAIEIEPSVRRLIHMRTQHLGPDELLVAAKVELIEDLEVVEVAEAVNRVETSIRRSVPTARLIYLEPDVFRTSLPDGEAEHVPSQPSAEAEDEAQAAGAPDATTAPASADTGAES